MRVLVLSQYFAPEVGATQARVHSFATALASRGHEVEVVCEIPNHPQGRVHPGYGGSLVQRRSLDGFRVSYAWVYTAPKKTALGRIGFYGSYMAMAGFVGSIRSRPDVVLASSPPLPVAVAGAAVAARHRVPWVLDVRDLWPEAAVAMGELHSPRLVDWVSQLAGRLYEGADVITVVTAPFRDAIASRVSRPDKIKLIPNGTSRIWLDAARLEPDRASLGLEETRFLWTFAGNVGRAQGLDAAIDAAAMLGEDYRLLVLGDGAARAGLEERAATLPAGRVEFRDQVEPEVAVRFLRASDALLVSLAPSRELRAFVPSKLFDFCAVERPVILAAAGEAPRLVTDAGAAVAVPPGKPEQIAAAVRRLRDDPALADRLVSGGSRFASDHLREREAERLADLVEGVAGGRDRGARDPARRPAPRPTRPGRPRARDGAEGEPGLSQTRILQVIGRLNIGGAAYQAGLLSGRRMDPDRYETLLVHGALAQGEESMTDFAEREGARLRYVPTLGRQVNPLADALALRKLTAIAREFRPHVVHTHTAKAGVLGRLAALRIRPRPAIVHTYHGHVLEGYFGPGMTRLYRALERLLARRSDCLIGVSHATVDELVRLGVAPRDRFRVIPPGLDLDRFANLDPRPSGSLRGELDVAEDEVLVTYIGRIVPIKRLDVLLLAIRAARTEGAPIRLAVVGDGEQRPGLERLARQLGIEGSVDFLGYRRDLRAIAAATDLYALSSDSEGTPVSLIEGAAAARPAVATAVGGVPEVVTPETGILVRPRDHAAFGNALARLAADAGLRSKLGERARQHVLHRYSATRLLADLAGLYEDLSGEEAASLDRDPASPTPVASR